MYRRSPLALGRLLGRLLTLLLGQPGPLGAQTADRVIPPPAAAGEDVATESGHDTHQDQPQVVAALRDPDSWDDLVACCTP